MNVLVIGGSGPSGQAVMSRALVLGLGVRALCHRDFPLPGKVEGRRGDVLDSRSLSSALAGCDAVISLLGPTEHSATDLCSRGYQNLVEAMTRTGVARLVMVTGAMIGHSREHRHGIYRLLPILMSEPARASIADRQLSERIVMGSTLDWTIVRPPRLRDGPGTGRLLVGADLRIGSLAQCVRTDLAEFVVEETMGPGHPRQALAVRTTPWGTISTTRSISSPA